MIHNLKPYPAYKDSGVPWLGKVPEHWEVKRQRNIAQMLVSNIDKHSSESEKPIRLCNYVDVYKNERITEHIPFMRATASLEEIKKFLLRVGDVVITKDSEMWNDIGVPALVEYEAPDLVCGYHLAILRPRDNVIIGPYFLRALQSQGVESQYYVSANGVTRYGLSHDAIKNVLIPIPPLTEQSAIVRYFDYIDRRIRRYIHAKQKLIKLLEEQKQAIIHQAVTRGLDPNVHLKPLGVEWLGDVPEHWEIVNLGRLIQLTTGFPFKSEGFSQNTDDIRLLRGINISPDRIRWNSVVHWSVADYRFYSDYSLKVGDIVLGMDRPIISTGTRVAKIQSEDVPSLLLQRVSRLRPSKELDNEYMLLLLRGSSFSDYLAPIFTGISVPHISPEQIRSFRIALPPIDEQLRIVEWVGQSTSKIELAVNRTSQEISLLREYRTRLIADVVTGKLDVREAAANLPEENKETEIFDDALVEDEGLESDGIDDGQAGEFEEEVLV